MPSHEHETGTAPRFSFKPLEVLASPGRPLASRILGKLDYLKPLLGSKAPLSFHAAAAEDEAENGRLLLRRQSRVKSIRRAVSTYFAPRGRFQKILEIAEHDNESDVYRRNKGHRVFTHDDWERHRHPDRYARHLALILFSKIFRALIPPIGTVMLVAVGVGVYETLLERSALPASWPHVTLTLGQGFQFISFALSLLLVFRTNSAYARWWEARTLWGALTNRTRDFARQALSLLPRRERKLREAALLWTAALPYVLKAHLREGAKLEAELEGILARAEIDAVVGATHRPNFVLAALSQILAAARLDPMLRARMDANLTAFEDTIGGCERILRTPIPQSYTRHTSRFLMIWLLMMPSTIWAAYSWGAVLLSGLFAYLMLGIDEIGVQIEEPFGVLPLGAFCATIERNLREMHYSADEVRHAAIPWLAPSAGCGSFSSGDEESDSPSPGPGSSDEDEDACLVGSGSNNSAGGRRSPLPAELAPALHLAAAGIEALVGAPPQAGAAAPALDAKDPALAPRPHRPHHHKQGSPHREHPGHHHAMPIPHRPGSMASSGRQSQVSLKDEIEEARPASYPRAAHWEPPERSWFAGRWRRATTDGA